MNTKHINSLHKFLTNKDPELRKFAKLLINYIKNKGFVFERGTVTDGFQFTLLKSEKTLTVKLCFSCWGKKGPSLIFSLFHSGLYIGGRTNGYKTVNKLKEELEEKSWLSLIC